MGPGTARLYTGAAQAGDKWDVNGTRGDVAFPPSRREGVTTAVPHETGSERSSRAGAWKPEVLRSRHVRGPAKNTGSQRTCWVQGPPSERSATLLRTWQRHCASCRDICPSDPHLQSHHRGLEAARPDARPGRQGGSLHPGASPVDDELVVGGWLVAHGAHPGGLLLVHLEVEDGIEALQVGAGLCPAGHREPHLHQLRGRAREQARPGAARPRRPRGCGRGPRNSPGR